MRENGQITEEQKTELLRRAQHEVDQAKIEREKMERERIGALQAGIDNGRPFLQSADGDFRVELGARLQIDYAAVENNTRTLAGRALSTILRAARPVRAVRHVLPMDRLPVRVRDELDRSRERRTDGKRSLPERRVSGLPVQSGVALRVGQFVVPFGYEETYSNRFTDQIERSIVDELEPEYSFGASLTAAS